MVRSRLLVAFAASASATSSPRAADDYALVRGVPLWDQGRSLPRCACPGSGVEIAFERVNDDFCDCAFGGDEPGTAACAGREHAAGFRCPGDGARVSASKVSDGVADCCDESDEGGPAPGGAAGGPCGGGVGGVAEDAAAYRAGAAERRARFGASARADDALADICTAEFASGPFAYSVCFGGRATQREGGASRLLGTLEAYDDERRAFRFGGGDACGADPRTATVALVCGGGGDRLVAVDEPAPCRYELTASSPAACDERRGADLSIALEASDDRGAARIKDGWLAAKDDGGAWFFYHTTNGSSTRDAPPGWRATFAKES